VLKYKRQAEQLLEASGLPYVLLRPGRLTDGPYTSYDVQLSAAETQNGEASRIAVAGLLNARAPSALRPSPPAILLACCRSHTWHLTEHMRHNNL
jgi:uncharacterized protein YbjT (DUF2867 family)